MPAAPGEGRGAGYLEAQDNTRNVRHLEGGRVLSSTRRNSNKEASSSQLQSCTLAKVGAGGRVGVRLWPQALRMLDMVLQDLGLETGPTPVACLIPTQHALTFLKAFRLGHVTQTRQKPASSLRPDSSSLPNSTQDALA